MTKALTGQKGGNGPLPHLHQGTSGPDAGFQPLRLNQIICLEPRRAVEPSARVARFDQRPSPLHLPKSCRGQLRGGDACSRPQDGQNQ